MGTHKKYNANKLGEYKEIIDSNLGLIKPSAEKIGISRRTFYEWTYVHPEFKQIVEDSREDVLDFAEHALFKNVRAGKETSNIFLLKCLGKGRGYIDKEIVEKPANAKEIAEELAKTIKEMDED